MPTSPTSGPGDGGGAATAPVALVGTDPDDVQLSVAGDAAQDANFFQVEGTASYFEIQADGAGNIDRVDALAERYRISTLNTGVYIFDDTWLFVTPELVYSGMSAAPADANISTGTFALWLDNTPGATKLMIKARDSIGTVRTAAIALS